MDQSSPEHNQDSTTSGQDRANEALRELADEIIEEDSLYEIAGAVNAGTLEILRHLLEKHEEVLENDRELAQDLLTLRVGSVAMVRKAEKMGG